MSAWAVEQRLVLGQLAVDGRSNEITAVPQLLALLALKGTVVTADALNWQRAIARQLIERGGDDVLALKGDQGALHADVRLFLDVPATPLHSAGSVDGGHGRIEERRAAVSTDIAWLQEHHHWPGLAAIGKVTARREEGGGKVTVRTRYYLLSRAFAPERFGALVRAHWDIENGLHWVLDVALDEDQPAPARTTAPRTSHCCGASPSTSPSLSRRKAPCAASSSGPAGTTNSSPNYSPSSHRPKCDSPVSSPPPLGPLGSRPAYSPPAAPQRAADNAT